MKGHEKVESKILSLDEWQNKFHSIIEKIHKKASHYAAAEIEADDIAESIKRG